MEPIGNAGLGCVQGRHAHGVRIDVGSQNTASCNRRRAARAGFGAQSLPKFGVVAAPARESEVVTGQRRRGVSRDQRRFDEKRSGPAHGIHQHAAGVVDGRPSGAQQHGCGHVFLQRRTTALDAIAAPVQAFAGKVHRHQRGGPFHVQMQQHVGTLGLDVRTFAGRIAQVVAHRIFEQLRTINGVTNRLVAAAAFARERRARCKMLAPIDALDGFKQAFRAARIDGAHAQQDPRRRARPQAGAVADFERALKLDVMAALTNVARAELRQFLGQHRGRPHRGGRDPIANIGVHVTNTGWDLAPRRSCQSTWGFFAK